MRFFKTTQPSGRGARRLAVLLLAPLLAMVTASAAQAATTDRAQFTVPVFQDCGEFSVSGEVEAKIKTKTHPDGREKTHYEFDGVVTRSDDGTGFRLHHNYQETLDPSKGTLTLKGTLFGIWDEYGSLIARDKGTIVFDLATWNILSMKGDFPIGPPPPPCWIYE